MSASIPFVILLILVHLGVYLTSPHRDRLKKLLQAFLVMVLAVPLFFLGSMMTEGTGAVIGSVLMYAPLFMPVLAFLVYVRRGRYP